MPRGSCLGSPCRLSRFLSRVFPAVKGLRYLTGRAAMISVLIFLILCVCGMGHAEESDKEQKEKDGKRLLVLPFPFYNDTIGGGIGAAVVAEGYVQKQMLTVGTLLFSTKGTHSLFMLVRNYQVPWLERLTLDPQMSTGKFEDVKTFTRGNPAFPNERPGSNDSSEDNFLEADGSDAWVDFKMKYLLPIGHGKDAIFPSLKVDNGVFVSGETGGEHWNPLTSGRTYVEWIPFYRNQDLSDENGTVQRTAGIDVALTYDNTDFPTNPSRGSYQRVFLSRDWGGFDSSTSWTAIGAEFAKYFSLGPSRNARQRVIAFNFWTVDCLTWDSSHTEEGRTIFHRPPTYKGASLGGLWRMRGYPASRFYDRSAINYGLEYRHTLRWNPLKNFTLKGRLDVDWFQVVAFGELGRVAPEWEIDTLHEDMKWTVGAGIRSMANNIVLRGDFGVSSEGGIVQLFIGHPF